MSEQRGWKTKAQKAVRDDIMEQKNNEHERADGAGKHTEAEMWQIRAVSDRITDKKHTHTTHVGRRIMWKLRAFHANAPCHQA